MHALVRFPTGKLQIAGDAGNQRNIDGNDNRPANRNAVAKKPRYGDGQQRYANQRRYGDHEIIHCIRGSDPSVYVLLYMLRVRSCHFGPHLARKPVEPAAETNGAMELMRMVLLGLTAKYYTISAAVRLQCGRNQTAAPAIPTHAQRQAYTVK